MMCDVNVTSVTAAAEPPTMKTSLRQLRAASATTSCYSVHNAARAVRAAATCHQLQQQGSRHSAAAYRPPCMPTVAHQHVTRPVLVAVQE